MAEKKSTHDDHITPLKVYLTVGVALLVLTAVTVQISLIHLGGWNIVVALGIATLKASLVALFFMHLLYDKKIYTVVFLTSVVFLAVFIVLTMFDTLDRGAVYEIEAQPIIKEAVIYRDKQPDTTTTQSHGH